MKRIALRLSLLAFLAAGCGGHGATQFGGNAPTGTRHFQFDCTICHAPDVTPGSEQPGQTLPTCNISACHQHDGLQPHRPTGVGSACTNCHMGHQSGNLFLVREAIVTPSGTSRAVDFTDNSTGRADGAFVSVTPPVRGVCQVCHTTTQFYHSDGSGDTHFTLPCYTCHSHNNGFLP
jgi:trimeric autotransporter adhesin